MTVHFQLVDQSPEARIARERLQLLDLRPADPSRRAYHPGPVDAGIADMRAFEETIRDVVHFDGRSCGRPQGRHTKAYRRAVLNVGAWLGGKRL
jgi:hypothetical protein